MGAKEEKMQLCELCLAKGLSCQLTLFQINLDEAVLLCSNDQCVYPLGVSSTTDLVVMRSAADMSPQRKRKRKLRYDGNHIEKKQKTCDTSPEMKCSYSCLRENSAKQNIPANMLNNNAGYVDHKLFGDASKSEKSSAAVAVKPTETTNSTKFLESFLQWQNIDNLCWLDVSLKLLVHCISLRKSLGHSPSKSGLIIKTVMDKYDEAQKLYRLYCHGHKGESSMEVVKKNLVTSVGTVAVCTGGGFTSPLHLKTQTLDPVNAMKEAQKILADVREDVWKFIQPRLKCKRGQTDSPVFALPHLLGEDEDIHDAFSMKGVWQMKCKRCSFSHRREVANFVLTFPTTDENFSFSDPSFPHSCQRCKRRVIMHLQVDRYPDAFFVHFVGGLRNADIASYDFSHKGVLYIVQTVVQYKTSPNHFVVWIRDAKAGKWMECDDMKSPECHFSQTIPTFLPSQVHLVMYQRAGCLNMTRSSPYLTEMSKVSGVLPEKTRPTEAQTMGSKVSLVSPEMTRPSVAQTERSKSSTVPSEKTRPAEAQTSQVTPVTTGQIRHTEAQTKRTEGDSVSENTRPTLHVNTSVCHNKDTKNVKERSANPKQTVSSGNLGKGDHHCTNTTTCQSVLVHPPVPSRILSSASPTTLVMSGQGSACARMSHKVSVAISPQDSNKTVSVSNSHQGNDEAVTSLTDSSHQSCAQHFSLIDPKDSNIIQITSCLDPMPPAEQSQQTITAITPNGTRIGMPVVTTSQGRSLESTHGALTAPTYSLPSSLSVIPLASSSLSSSAAAVPICSTTTSFDQLQLTPFLPVSRTGSVSTQPTSVTGMTVPTNGSVPGLLANTPMLSASKQDKLMQMKAKLHQHRMQQKGGGKKAQEQKTKTKVHSKPLSAESKVQRTVSLPSASHLTSKHTDSGLASVKNVMKKVKSEKVLPSVRKKASDFAGFTSRTPPLLIANKKPPLDKTPASKQLSALSSRKHTGPQKKSVTFAESLPVKRVKAKTNSKVQNVAPAKRNTSNGKTSKGNMTGDQKKNQKDTVIKLEISGPDGVKLVTINSPIKSRSTKSSSDVGMEIADIIDQIYKACTPGESDTPNNHVCNNPAESASTDSGWTDIKCDSGVLHHKADVNTTTSQLSDSLLATDSIGDHGTSTDGQSLMNTQSQTAVDLTNFLNELPSDLTSELPADLSNYVNEFSFDEFL